MNAQVAAGPGSTPVQSKASNRVLVYRLLSEILGRIPDVRLVNALREPTVAATFEGCGYDLGLSGLPEDAGAAATALAIEYGRLFEGPGHLLSLYESVNRPSGHRRLWDDCTRDVHRTIRGLGLSPKIPGRVPDHISVELDLMAHLAAAECEVLAPEDAEARETVRAGQRRLLDEHLLLFASELAAAVERVAALPLYRSTLRLTAEVLEIARAELGDDEPRAARADG